MKIPNQQPQQQQQQTPITINGNNLKEVISSTYLGITVSTTGGGTDEDVKSSQRGRIGNARQTFMNLKPVWREIFCTQHVEQDVDFQHQREVSACVWFRDLGC
ncbi:unnamed protein product [Heterobilharzia americana]|nr:unnamed protein product [Heterobilharzia americana]